MSLVPVLGKVFDFVIKPQVVYFYFENNNFFSNSQFSFRSSWSTTDTINSMVQGVLGAFERKSLAQITAVDPNMAFDCINYGLFLSKLKYDGM